MEKENPEIQKKFNKGQPFSSKVVLFRAIDQSCHNTGLENAVNKQELLQVIDNNCRKPVDQIADEQKEISGIKCGSIL